MSPEQVRGDVGGVGAASDVYALGAIAYELLTGSLPLDVRDLGLTAAARAIAEQAPPPASAHRPALAGDLDAILACALEKDPARRYASAGALAADLERHLRSEPVLARPPSLFTSLRKLASRHRAAAAAALAVVVVSLTAALVSVRFGLEARAAEAREREERERVEREERRTRAVNRFLNEVLGVADPFTRAERAGGEVTMGEALDLAARRVGPAFAGDPAAEVAVRTTLAASYKGLARYDDALEQLALALERNATREDADAARDGLRVRREAALVRAWQGEHDAALAGLQEAVRELRARDGGDGELAVALAEVVFVLRRARRFEEALPVAEEAHAVARRAFPEGHETRADVATAYAAMLRGTGDLERARALYEESLAIYRARYPAGHPALAVAINNLARLDLERGDLGAAGAGFEEAARMLQRGIDVHPSLGDVLNNLAAVRHDQSDHQAAETAYQEALAVYRECLGEDHPEYAGTLNNYAFLLRDTGRIDEAEDAFGRFAVFLRALHGDDHWRVILAEANLADCAWRAGRVAEGETALLGCYERFVTTQGHDAPYVPDLARMLVRLYEGTDRPDLAAPYRAVAAPE